MALQKHRDEAADRLKKAAVRIDEARAMPASIESMQAWLSALTDFSLALSDLHTASIETIQEQLDDVVRRQRQASSMIS